MQQVTIRNTCDWLVISHGNGLAYSLTQHNGARQSLFLQGDDASAFAAQLEAMENAAPDRDSDAILCEIFTQYQG